MSKNIFDYIQMGLRSKRQIQNKAAEQEKKIRDDAQAFNKAFTDKTYTVAKKVIENVEKVADYDYEALFNRVNKVFEDPKKPTSNVDRQARSKALEEKLKEKGFNIKSTIPTQGNYKNSIIEKTKKNIQKKIIEADERHKENMTQNTTDDASEDESNQNKLVSVSIINIDESETRLENQNDINSDDTSEVKSDSDLNTLDNEGILEDQEKSETETEEVMDRILESEDEVIDTISEPEDAEVVIDEIKEEPVIDAIHEEIDILESPNEVSDHGFAEAASELVEENQVIDEPLSNFEEEKGASISVELKDIDEEIHHMNESVNGPVLHEEVQQVTETPLEDPSLSDIISDDYSKDKTKKNKRYYKEKQKEKFAKRMKVELEDNIIVKKKRSVTRLFRFSLSFKLSFVFMMLLIVTVVSLSLAFYFGIDYVIDLKDAGKMTDIQLFKDVLLVLLIIFNLVAILLSISVGTKTSRGLVSPLNEMTRIVQQINAKEMDRRLNVKGMHDELKELAMTFNEMLDRIENSYETQNRFTSDASHELRTPIAVIQGYINMLDRWGKADDAILDESIEAIKSESHNMKRLTEKLLLLAKADKGILELEFKPFSLKDLIEEITKETCMIDSNHTITNAINDVEQVIADRESLKQAIRIFVDNSVKYTPEGGHIQINSYFRKRKIYIEIADDGIGIAKEDMENIFNRFYRVDKSRSKESGGHGLGLSISKWIINEHKGEIEVKSEVGKGTVVTIILTPMT